jgi:hypothetical protein
MFISEGGNLIQKNVLLHTYFQSTRNLPIIGFGSFRVSIHYPAKVTRYIEKTVGFTDSHRRDRCRHCRLQLQELNTRERRVSDRPQ